MKKIIFLLSCVIAFTSYIQKETLTVTTNGNGEISSMTGKTETTTTYAYESQAGNIIAQFLGGNNWIAATTPEGTFDFTVNNIETDRISTKNSFYDLGEGATITQSEVFNYVN